MNRALPPLLQIDDPLYAFLCEEVLGRCLGHRIAAPEWAIHPLGRDGATYWIYRYQERTSGLAVVCKFYGTKPLFDGWIGDRNLRALLMERELRHLAQARGLGLDRPPYQVVRPLAMSREINCVLVQDYAPGTDLQADLDAAARAGTGDGLRARLAQLAAFLAALHDRSRSPVRLVHGETVARLSRLVEGLAARRTIAADEEARYADLAQRWTERESLGEGLQTLVHGDASPSHFLFDDRQGLTAIDFEGLRSGDPAEDVGRVLAEIRQAFFHHRGEAAASEPYLRHFFAAYQSARSPGAESPQALAERALFFLGYFQMCIGRNFRLDLAYRRRLMAEAAACLQGESCAPPGCMV